MGFIFNAIMLLDAPHRHHASTVSYHSVLLTEGFGWERRLFKLSYMHMGSKKTCYGVPRDVGFCPSIWVFGIRVFSKGGPVTGRDLWCHGDEEVMVSNGFKVVAKSEQGAVVAMEYNGRWFYGL
ncbi:hypothetical protein Tco_0126462 [Tanacetum coccineum]